MKKNKTKKDKTIKVAKKKDSTMSEVAEVLLWIYLAFSLVWAFVWAVTAIWEKWEKRICTYESIGWITNIGYVVTCEIFKPRFLIPKPTTTNETIK